MRSSSRQGSDGNGWWSPVSLKPIASYNRWAGSLPQAAKNNYKCAFGE